MRFLVVTKRNGIEKLNGETSPFGAVLERDKGFETIDKIGRATTYNTSPTEKDSPSMYRIAGSPLSRHLDPARRHLLEGETGRGSHMGHGARGNDPAGALGGRPEFAEGVAVRPARAEAA